MASTRTVETTEKDWPPRPPGEVFPPVLTTVVVAQLLAYDLAGCTVAQGIRNVRILVRDKGMPTLPALTNGHRFDRDRVLEWWRNLDREEKELGPGAEAV